MLGTPDNAGVPAPESFAKWFRDTPGHNVAVGYSLEFVSNGAGEFVFQRDDFTPIDGEHYGNGGAEHNRGFTVESVAEFTTGSCSGQYIEVSGELDAWIFVDGQLALDLGGAKNGATQRLDIDRLGLSSGETHEVKFFLAQRGDTAAIEIRTNIDLVINSELIKSFANARVD